MKKTLSYYDTHADTFIQETRTVDFSKVQNLFLSKLEKGMLILDFGCGSGRDTKYFLENGYAVEAIDGSVEMCHAASQYTGITVKQMLFQELNTHEKYDAIWACSSILHLPIGELKTVLQKMCHALKPSGIAYVSFKYGTFAGERNGRYFLDMTEAAFAEILTEVNQFQIEEEWITGDVRQGRGAERWLNLLLRKQKEGRLE